MSNRALDRHTLDLREGGQISFSAEVKAELAGLVPARACCQLHELLGIFYSTRGRVVAGPAGTEAAYFRLLLNTVARKVVRLGRVLAHMEARYHTVRSSRRTTFYVELPLPPQLEAPFGGPARRPMPDRACDRKAMLRGLFLGCGSVNAPSASYHMEWVAPTAGSARLVLGLAQQAQIPASRMERNGGHVVYVKAGDGIVRGLSLMGASRAVMEFENVRVIRELTAQVNRRLNFETANIERTIGSALRQLAAIESLAASPGLGRLPPALRDMARWRRQHPEMNLTELAAGMELSKSAVNHRLRRLIELGSPPEPKGQSTAGG